MSIQAEAFICKASRESAIRLAFDQFFAGLGLIVLSPVFAAISLAIKLDDGGAVFYAQQRVGKEFRLFRLLKFRSMVPGADRRGLLTSAGDTRRTRVGRVLRKHKLDELPQLFNVLKGDMQLVGPRPEVERYVQMFRDEYTILLQRRPGITDPATLAFRREEEVLQGDAVEGVYVSRILPEKLNLSLAYHRGRRFVSDLRILLQTVLNLPVPLSPAQDACEITHPVLDRNSR
jgi:lipopolysaccharide/colanic/teichoic acid biosynthesis glycosyltransferase